METIRSLHSSDLTRWCMISQDKDMSENLTDVYTTQVRYESISGQSEGNESGTGILV